MELSLRKAQANIREAHEKGEIGPECDSFIDLSEKWWSALVTVSPDGGLSPTANGQTVAAGAIPDLKRKRNLKPDDDCARPYRRGK
ncbi:hypothetical protein Trisim1_010795 [Trichoderma cf. simile WF8]